jgi:hypothetical protein
MNTPSCTLTFSSDSVGAPGYLPIGDVSDLLPSCRHHSPEVPPFRGLGRLAVHDPSTGGGFSTPLATHLLPQPGVQHFPSTIQFPETEVVIDSLIATDKFCLTRHHQCLLRLRPRRSYAPREDAHRGGGCGTEMAGSANDFNGLRRTASLGPGLPSPPEVGKGPAQFQSSTGGAS